MSARLQLCDTLLLCCQARSNVSIASRPCLLLHLQLSLLSNRQLVSTGTACSFTTTTKNTHVQHRNEELLVHYMKELENTTRSSIIVHHDKDKHHPKFTPPSNKFRILARARYVHKTKNQKGGVQNLTSKRSQK